MLLIFSDPKGWAQLTPAQAANAGIAFATADSRAEAGVLEATAQIEPAADRVAKIGSRVPGRVVDVRVSVGDRVSTGQTVVVLDSPEVGQAKADYLSALATATLARETAHRERQLFERRVSAEREWREAEAEATRAEAAVQADPRTACFYARVCMRLGWRMRSSLRCVRSATTRPRCC